MAAAKPVSFRGSSREDLRRFPEDARSIAGFELGLVQLGKHPTDWKPVPSVGPGVIEIRIHRGGAFRVFYVATFPEAVYVLHAFEKKQRRTPRRDIEIGRARYRALLRERQQ